MYRTALCGVGYSGCSEAAAVRALKLKSTKTNEGEEEAGYPNISQRQQQAWEDIRWLQEDEEEEAKKNIEVA